MMTLFKTECRQLWPLAILWLLLELLNTAMLLFSSRIDETEYAVLCDAFCQPGVANFAIYLLLAIVVWVGWSLFPRDADDGTLAHLQSLALSRPQIYAAKVLAGMALLVFFYVFSAAVTYTFVALNPQTLHGKYYLALDAQFFVRGLAFSFIVLAYAVFLSSFRLMGLVLFAAYFAVVAYVESLAGYIGAWNLLNLMYVDYFGSTLIIDWSLFAVHGVLAVVALILGYQRWMRREVVETHRKLAITSPWLTVPLMVLVFLGLMGGLMQHSQQRGAQRDAAYDTLETEHYRFVYFKSAAPYAEELAADADDLLVRVASYLNSDTPPIIQTDLTSNTSHVAGLAVHNRIRMRLQRFAQSTENRFVLAHETVHIFQSFVTDRQLKKVNASANFFIEGMAQHVAFAVEPDDTRREINWLVGALAAHRNDIKFTDMVDTAGFAEQFDAELPYTLGDLWVDTMVEVCGPDSLGKFLTIVGADDAVLTLRGVAFWRQHLQRLPCELEDINFRFQQRVDELATSEAAAAIPETRNVTIRADEDDADVYWMDVTVNNGFAIDSDGIPTAGQDYLLRLKNTASLARGIDSTIMGYPKSKDEPNVITFRLSQSRIQQNRFRYQLGYVGGYDYRAVFDKWQSATLPR